MFGQAVFNPVRGLFRAVGAEAARKIDAKIGFAKVAGGKGFAPFVKALALGAHSVVAGSPNW